MALTEARRNEIAWMLLVQKLQERGLSHLKPNEFKRDMANGAKKIGISIEEATEFARMSIIPLVEALFEQEKPKDGHNFYDGVERG
jgi:hypothetical protein